MKTNSTFQALNRRHFIRDSAARGLDEKHHHLIHYRSPEPVPSPELSTEREGFVSIVAFPTAIDRRGDLELPDRFDVYCGRADYCIGVAQLELPEKYSVERYLEP